MKQEVGEPLTEVTLQMRGTRGVRGREHREG